MKLSDKLLMGAMGAAVASMSAGGAVALALDIKENGHKPAEPAFGPNGTDVITDNGRLYIVKPTVPRL